MDYTYAERERERSRAFERIWGEVINDVFADVAKYYDRANAFATLGLIDPLRAGFIDTMRLRPHARVLDVCAGTNVVGIDLLRREPTLEVHAMDRSQAMQAVGGERARARGLEIRSHIGDVHRLPFPDGHFDVVTLQWATRHLRAARVVAEIRRVLKPGGGFYHCDMLRPANRLVEEAYCLYLTACVGLVSWAFRSAPAALSCRRYFVDAIRLFYSAEEFSHLLRAHGFESVVGRPVLFGTVAYHRAIKPFAA